MKKSLLLLIVTIFVSANSYGHSGRTDKNGGHNCSAASIEKGLCTGYHYHNGRAYLDVGEELVEVASLNDDNHFHNIDADDHESTASHVHSHNIDPMMKQAVEPPDANQI